MGAYWCTDNYVRFIKTWLFFLILPPVPRPQRFDQSVKHIAMCLAGYYVRFDTKYGDIFLGNYLTPTPLKIPNERCVHAMYP